MPNGRTHTWVGAASGSAVAVYRGRQQPLLNVVLEGLGGGIGGYLGGKVPDILEPASHPGHRDFCHSWTAGGVLATGLTALEKWEVHCREKAADIRTQRLATPSPGLATSLFQILVEILWSLAAGVLSGFGAGYISHLLLDATTPRGLPAFCK